MAQENLKRVFRSIQPESPRENGDSNGHVLVAAGVESPTE